MTEVIRTGALVHASRAERDGRFPALAEILAPYSVSVALPLVTRGRPMGALALHRRSAEPLSPEMLAFMESFAQQCAQALERARLYEAERRARQEADDARARADLHQHAAAREVTAANAAREAHERAVAACGK